MMIDHIFHSLQWRDIKFLVLSLLTGCCCTIGGGL
jgi:hypothetical protein